MSRTAVCSTGVPASLTIRIVTFKSGPNAVIIAGQSLNFAGTGSDADNRPWIELDLTKASIPGLDQALTRSLGVPVARFDPTDGYLTEGAEIPDDRIAKVEVGVDDFRVDELVHRDELVDQRRLQ